MCEYNKKDEYNNLNILNDINYKVITWSYNCLLRIIVETVWLNSIMIILA